MLLIESTDCMHVTSEDGIFTYRKTLRKPQRSFQELHLVEVEPEEPQVCGVYFMTDPDKIVEVEVEFMDVSCELGGLLGVRALKIILNDSIKNKFLSIVCRWVGVEW